MAVETMKSHHAGEGKTDEKALRDAAAAGIQGVEQVIRLLSGTQQPGTGQTIPNPSEPAAEIMAATDATVNHFRKVISLLDRPRAGHARFKRAPAIFSTQPQTRMATEQRGQDGSTEKVGFSAFRVYCPTPVHRLPPLPHQSKTNLSNPLLAAKNGFSERNELTGTVSFSRSQAISGQNSLASSLTAGETESGHRSLSSGFQFTSPSLVHSSGKPPLSSSVKRRCNSMNDAAARHCTPSSGRCHCPKKRKLRVKRVTRVPAISNKMSDVPPDEYSWRKYGQKAIKGSPHQRGYYKCSSMKGCPARKRVERAVDDPMILVVTYEGDHNHSNDAAAASVVL